MIIAYRNDEPYEVRLTTEHSASSYGQPVLVADDGQAFGPGDVDMIEASRDEHAAIADSPFAAKLHRNFAILDRNGDEWGWDGDTLKRALPEWYDGWTEEVARAEFQRALDLVGYLTLSLVEYEPQDVCVSTPTLLAKGCLRDDGDDDES